MVDFITEENFLEFKKLYKKAVKEKQDMFIYQKQDVLTNFAKYLIEYHEQVRK